MARLLLPPSLSFLLLAGAMSTAAPTKDEPPAPAPPQVAYEAGYLTVQAAGASRERVLAMVAEATGAEIQGAVVDTGPITITLDDVPLTQGIERLLGDQNFTMRYGADGSVRRITLRGPAGDPPRPPRRGERSTQRRPNPSFLTGLARHPPIQVHGRLAASLGKQQVRLTQLVRSLRREQDRSIREQAMRRFLRAVEHDADLRGGLAQLLPKQLADFARRNTGARSPEFLRFLATNARNNKVRARAAAAERLAKAPQRK